MFEHHTKPLLPMDAFLRRVAKGAVLSLGLIGFSVGVGMLGYHHFEHMTWIDAFANASMILSGMGPLQPMQTFDGKLFAGFYALYSGLAFITIAGVAFAPLFHRFLHRFHLEVPDDTKDS